jgi:DNA repair exonuclease SbcCD ATPase subunit
MNEHTSNPAGGCACDPFPASVTDQGCAGCSPNMILTCEEEAILTKMREIKAQVAPIAEKLTSIQKDMGESVGGFSPVDTESDWHALNDQLQELRNQWQNWQALLEEAINKKLILLGHREV